MHTSHSMNTKNQLLLRLAVFAVGLTSLNAHSAPRSSLSSPSGLQKVQVSLASNGALHACVMRGDKLIVKDLTFGNTFSDGSHLREGLTIIGTKSRKGDQHYKLPVGKASQARDYYNELTLSLAESGGLYRHFQIQFRAYDDGVAFRYLFPKQAALKDFIITEELTTFEFPGNHTCWAALWDRPNNPNETDYARTRINDLNPDAWLQRPMTLQRDDGVTLCLYEADLTDYAGLYFCRVAGHDNTLRTRLVPRFATGATGAVHAATPCASPWRVIQIAATPADLIASTLVLNLNAPSSIKDTSWVVPGKMIFPWWPNFRTDRPGVPNRNTFENQKDYIDFAAENGIRYLELEPPWYETKPGVEDGKQSPDTSDPLKPLPEIRLPELIAYAHARNVGVFLWIHWSLLVHDPDQIMATYKKWGAVGIKVDFFDRSDQEMVNIYHQIARKAAEHNLMLYYHGAYNPTGMQRTWPNVLTYEGVMGNEWNKWSDRVTLQHTLTLPFTRMVTGPMDFTPGGFRNVMPKDFKVDFDLPSVMGTRSRQLAMFVVYESAAQMLCDWPGAYRGQPGLDFLKIVPTSWDETQCLDGAIGEHALVARRQGEVWYLGAMTDQQPRTVEIPLGFLKTGKAYDVQWWTDPLSGGAATDLVRSKTQCAGGADQKLTIRMAAGGGAVLVLTPAESSHRRGE